MTAHQATARTALLPMAVPSSRPRSVSMTGVNGWYSANQRRAVGIESAGTNPLPRNGRSSKGMGRLLAASTVLLTRPQATDSRGPLDGAGGGPEADQQGDPDDDGQAARRLGHGAEDVAGQDGGAEDGHGAEAGDDPLGHVHGDRDRRSLGDAGHGHQQDPRGDVREVLGAAACRVAEPVAQGAAEDVDEKQQEDDRQAGDHQRQGRVAPHVPEVAAQHGPRIARRVGEGAHGRVALSLSGWPVRARKTSSRSGRWTERLSTSTDAPSSRSSRPRSDRTPPSLGTSRVSVSSSRADAARAWAADSSPCRSANCRRTWPPGTRRFSASGAPSAISRPWSRTATWSAS